MTWLRRYALAIVTLGAIPALLIIGTVRGCRNHIEQPEQIGRQASHGFCSTVHANPKPTRSAYAALLSGPANAVLTPSKRWPNGSTLRVKNLDLPPATFDQVMADGREWCQYANLNLVVSNDADAEVRVSGSRLGAWAYIGTDARTIPANQPTMNFGWYDRGTGRHEWGHILGFEHEHRRADRPWHFNLSTVYADNAAIGWDKAMTDAQIINTLNPASVWATPFDIDGIMEYWMPQSWTIEGIVFPFNTVLTDCDKIMAATAYPGRWIDPRPQQNASGLASLRAICGRNLKPHPVAYCIESGTVTVAEKCFTRTNIVLVIGLRIGNNRIQLWAVTFDGITMAAIQVVQGVIIRE